MSDGGAATCLSPHQVYLCAPGYINTSDLATNAATAPRPLPQSNTPGCMLHSSKSPRSDHGWETFNIYSAMTGARDDSLTHSQPVHSESNNQTDVDKARLLRSRPLRLSTLYQPVYHSDSEDATIPPCPPTFSTFFQDSSKEQDDSPCTPSFQKLKHFRQALHLPRLPPDFTFSFLDSPSLWLAMYFALNLSLTLYNKSVLIHFPFPYTLTALHAFCGTIGASVLLRLQGPGLAGALMNGTLSKASWFHRITPELSAGELVVLLFFSMLYTINIVVSNASLRLVTVPFHQVVRASTPFFTIVFAWILLGKRCSRQKLVTLVPVVAGVGFATYGDYYFTPVGFLLTLLGTLLAALKTILTNIILVKQPPSPLPFSSDSSNYSPSDDVPNQSSSSPSFFSGLLSIVTFHFFDSSSSSNSTVNSANSSIKTPALSSLTLPKLSLSPLHLLYFLSPLALIQTILLAHLTGELSQVQLHIFHASSTAHPEGDTYNFRMWLVSNGILAFFLNVVSFNANRRVGPLAMTVAANVKQVLTVLCAVFIFDLTITPANAVGILLTIAGGALYAAVEFREKQSGKRWLR